MYTLKNKDINKKNKQNYPNYHMQMMLLKPVLCLYNNKKWSNHSKYMQPTGEQLSIIIGDEYVGQAWWNYVCQNSADVYLQCSYLQFLLSPSRRREAPCEGTNPPRLFTPGETKALAKSKVHQ